MTDKHSRPPALLRQILRAMRWLIPVALGVWIVARIDLVEAGRLIRSAELPLVLAAVVALIASLVVRMARWVALLGYVGVEFERRTALRAFVLDFSGSALLGEGLGAAGRLVDFSAAGKSDLVAVGYAVGADKAYEVATLVLLALPASLLLQNQALDPLIVAAAALVVLVLVGFLFTPRGVRLVTGLLGRFRIISSTEQAISVVGVRHHLGLMGMSLAARLVHFLFAWLVALAVGIRVGFVEMSAVMAIVGLVVMVPVSVGGLGTRDASMIWLLGVLGVAAEPAAGTSLLIFAITMTLRLVLGVWWGTSRPDRGGVSRETSP